MLTGNEGRNDEPQKKRKHTKFEESSVRLGSRDRNDVTFCAAHQ